MMLVLLLACGSEAPLAQPAPPPSPPPELAAADPEVITHSGIIQAVSGDTRTWVATGDSQRFVFFLTEAGVLEVDGRAGLVGELPVHASVTATGRRVGDLVLVQRASVSTAPPADPLAAPVPPATETPAAPAVPSPAATPAAPAAGG